MIGSAQLYRLLIKRFRLKNLHDIYFTSAKRTEGKRAEEYVFKTFNNYLRGCCFRSSNFPFLCASPDGFVS